MHLALPDPSPVAGRVRRRGLTVTILAVALLLSVAASATAAPAATITITGPDTVPQGERVELVVTATDVADLYAYDLRLTTDTEALVLVPQEVTGPEGGFTSGTSDEQSHTVTHTRLGTSPGLEGEQTFARIALQAEGSGTVSLDLSSAQLVAADGTVVDLTDLGSLDLVIEADEGSPAPPTPDTETSPGDETENASSDEPAAEGALAGLLPATGASLALWLLVAAALMVAAGAWLRRRTGAQE